MARPVPKGSPLYGYACEESQSTAVGEYRSGTASSIACKNVKPERPPPRGFSVPHWHGELSQFEIGAWMTLSRPFGQAAWPVPLRNGARLVAMSRTNAATSWAICAELMLTLDGPLHCHSLQALSSLPTCT